MNDEQYLPTTEELNQIDQGLNDILNSLNSKEFLTKDDLAKSISSFKRKMLITWIVTVVSIPIIFTVALYIAYWVLLWTLK